MKSMPYAEPWRIKMIEPLKTLSRDERMQKIENAEYNLFNLKSEDVFIDLLTDSGTGAMSDRQWSALMQGDESYAGSRSFLALKETVKNLLGFPFMLPTHQGRAAENVLLSALLKEDDYVPGNAHFDTTKGHIEFRKAHAIDCSIDEAGEVRAYHPFKGNIDCKKLEDFIVKVGVNKVPVVILTVTCNTGGGQPVSMQNIKDVSAVCKKYNIPLMFDSARFAENAYFIKQREDGYQDKTIKEIVKEMFNYADAMTMSSKKDGIVNIGGFIGLKDENLYRECTVFNIMFEGFITYGGMSGRDMAALAVGLDEATEFDYLHARISQIEYLGNKLKEAGIPLLEPFGGHAIYVDAKDFLPHIPPTQYPAQVLGVELYIESGVRAVEIGTVLADRDPVTREERVPKMELLRLAIPRRVYTNNHMDMIVWGLQQVWENRKSRTGLRIKYEAPIMRHFTATFEKI
ncbi:MAG: tryptophanase [Candidatus Cloacimonadales bacterium]|jgi:tryptophanase|nr:tryptophanase [Candidatus Cloacimonadota bacterium]MDD2649986.1 tryptophanase [Candidatus Cloacimonadota bacterium]MDD3501501.1 tryptophanase [Candidatus Cloacimonadota bacterium]MDX9977028.1 tryptophanase [Candidatus Cloacimonadales bacterium]